MRPVNWGRMCILACMQGSLQGGVQMFCSMLQRSEQQEPSKRVVCHMKPCFYKAARNISKPSALSFLPVSIALGGRQGNAEHAGYHLINDGRCYCFDWGGLSAIATAATSAAATAEQVRPLSRPISGSEKSCDKQLQSRFFFEQ
jgi:hypothetical protein